MTAASVPYGGPYAPSVPPLPGTESLGGSSSGALSGAAYQVPVSSHEGKGRSSDDTRSAYPSVNSGLLDRGSGGQYGYFPQQGYGSFQQFGQPSPPAYGIPVWQNQPIWSTGLFECCADVPICLLTCLCPCIAFGRNAEALDEGNTSCLTAALVWWLLQQTTALGCLYSCGYRKKLRSKYNISRGPVPDSLIHLFCWPCAICQEYREIHFRSFGPDSWTSGRPIMNPPPQQSFLSYQRLRG